MRWQIEVIQDRPSSGTRYSIELANRGDTKQIDLECMCSKVHGTSWSSSDLVEWRGWLRYMINPLGGRFGHHTRTSLLEENRTRSLAALFINVPHTHTHARTHTHIQHTPCSLSVKISYSDPPIRAESWSWVVVPSPATGSGSVLPSSLLGIVLPSTLTVRRSIGAP